ncbi:MAG: molybdopterin molybdotransferase MoeA [Propionibacteriaceae bacterium]|jgi:molybdopterin molybdotransferase|nr:molybdopterin molybdotransferase MoeA [Propionibacteriaceae bacterium]
MNRTSRSVEQHLTAVLALAGVPVGESVPLDQAAGRVLAEDLVAEFALPRFANSAMDGFALRHHDLALLSADGLPLAGRLLAGDSPQPLPAGQAVRIMTGAPLPAGADTVVPLERATERAGRVVLAPEVATETLAVTGTIADGRPAAGAGHQRPGGPDQATARGREVVSPEPAIVRGANVRHPGEDVAPGQLVLTRGCRLGPRHLAAAAACGRDRLTVARRPQVAVVMTGDELTAPGAALGAATVANCNGPYLVAAVAQAGGEVVEARRTGDDEAVLEAVLEGLTADLIVVTGDASAGDRDVARALLGREGVEFVRVRMRPGQPQGAGRWRGRAVLSLPGNPVSVAVSAAVFLRPLLQAWLGAAPPALGQARLTQGWKSPTGKRQFMPVRPTTAADGRLEAAPAAPVGAGSHLVASLAGADALAVIPEDWGEAAAGAMVELVELD